MSAFKQLLASDVIVSPFEVNKGFSFNLSQFGEDNVQINRLWGRNVDYLTNPSLTGDVNVGRESKALVYNSIKELYYGNYLSGSLGSPAATSSLIPGDDSEGDRFVGPIQTTNYDNYLSTTLSLPRFFPTGFGEGIAVFSIPSRLFGDNIQPGSFRWEDNGNGVTFTDDNEGNIISGSTIVGTITYPHGLIVLTSQNIGGRPPNDFVDSTNVTCWFSSSYTILETQYKTTIRESEFNFSLNPSLTSGSEGALYDFVTGSYFSPYITTVGLYNDNQELLAIGKLSQPLPTSKTTDTNIFINLDK
mgnify:CR=1 FL=1